ncbi:MAG: A/G-specific adenine glycosylase [Synoicihabitans sp.]
MAPELIIAPANLAVATTFPDNPTDFQNDLLSWYQANRRTLPWRESPSLYGTVVSEFMLQQTQVKTALPYFERWMRALPDFPSLAAADEAQVLKLWEGLGYYSRARNLHKLARAFVQLPAPPNSREDWQALPGIGPYASAAIASIAQNLPVACVDGNVVRILARLTADGRPFRDSASASKAFTPLADHVLNRAQPGDHNQAMMELGATVCHRRNPLCTVCPVRRHCSAGQAGDPESYPRLEKVKFEDVAITRAWCVSDDRLLLHHIASDAKRLAGQYELPSSEHIAIPKSAPVVAVKKRGITRYRITETIKQLPVPAELPAPLEWVEIAQLGHITLSGPHRRWITELVSQPNAT